MANHAVILYLPLFREFGALSKSNNGRIQQQLLNSIFSNQYLVIQYLGIGSNFFIFQM